MTDTRETFAYPIADSWRNENLGGALVTVADCWNCGRLILKLPPLGWIHTGSKDRFCGIVEPEGRAEAEEIEAPPPPLRPPEG
jgi:hypothetical protein